MPEEHTRTLRGTEDLARAVAASVLDRPVADLTSDTSLDSDDLDLVIVELSLSGIEIDRRDVKTLGQLIARLPLCGMGSHYRGMAAQLRELARRCHFRTGRGDLVQLAATFEHRAERSDDGWR